MTTLRARGLQVEAQAALAGHFHGEVIGHFYADSLVEGIVIVELKAVSAVLKEHSAQRINYLTATGVDVGLLVNFGRSTLEFRRVYRPQRQDILSCQS